MFLLFNAFELEIRKGLQKDICILTFLVLICSLTPGNEISEKQLNADICKNY